MISTHILIKKLREPGDRSPERAEALPCPSPNKPGSTTAPEEVQQVME